MEEFKELLKSVWDDFVWWLRHDSVHAILGVLLKPVIFFQLCWVGYIALARYFGGPYWAIGVAIALGLFTLTKVRKFELMALQLFVVFAAAYQLGWKAL